MQKKIITTFLFLFIQGLSFLKAETGVVNKDTAYFRNNIPADPILAAIDSLHHVKMFEAFPFVADTAALNIHHFMPDSVPSYLDIVYEYRLDVLNRKSVINLEYREPVLKYIDLYAFRKREEVSKMLGLAQLYFPLFESMLDKYNLPQELKYLAVVESALNPLAKSKSGATGLWQFLYHSGRMFDLQVDNYIDERCDPYKATEAACRYFEYLYRIFRDWHLVLAAYNGGPGMMRNAIIRSGGKINYWELRPYLPVETQGYVPAFIAACYIMNYASVHNIFPVAPKILFSQTDTISVRSPVSFQKLSSATGIPVDMLRFLNPMYRRDYISGQNTPMKLILPHDKMVAYLTHEKEISGYPIPGTTYFDMLSNAGDTSQKKMIMHHVEKGEFTHQLAIRYYCTIEDIKVWNNLASEELGYGQKLKIWIPPSLFNNNNIPNEN